MARISRLPGRCLLDHTECPWSNPHQPLVSVKAVSAARPEGGEREQKIRWTLYHTALPAEYRAR